jgi:glycosyltransferase involved in cell wall biosynthesis
MKLLMTATSLDASYGGPAFSVSQLAAALGRVGVEVGLWSADGSAAGGANVLTSDAPVHRLGGELREAATVFAPEVVHDNGLWLPHNHQIAGLAQAAGWPRVVSTRGMLEPWAVRHKRWKKAAAWRLYQHRDLQRAEALHATAEAEAANLAALRLRAPVHTIANGVDLPELAPDRKPGDAPMTAVFLGRLYPVKGLPMLVEAWARARPAGWRLILAGPDEAGHQREVEAAVAAAGLQDVVSFPGPVSGAAKADLLQGADLFVLPSHSESFGMALAEALSHGAPVLTTTAVPWPALETRQCGWRVPPTVEGLAEGLRIAAARDRPTLNAMGAAGRELIAAEYGWPRIASAFVALYEELARGARAPRGRMGIASVQDAAA